MGKTFLALLATIGFLIFFCLFLLRPVEFLMKFTYTSFGTEKPQID